VDGGKLPAGKRLGPYEVVGLIGSGGMGDVYRARDTRLGRDVAVKVLAASASADPHAVQRFRQEAQAASALNHPNIVTVYDIGATDDIAFIVTELLEGETLRHAIERRRLAPPQVLACVAQAATGLAAAHSKGILHRDIKPENLFLTRDGTLKILDFGISKLTADSGGSEPANLAATAPGVLVGTAGYVSPEQIRQQTVDHRTDIFSLGVVLYEALAGEPPFRGDSLADTLSAILTEEPPQLSRLRPGLTAAIDEVVRACLDKNPEHRFESAADLALTLHAVAPLLGSQADDAPRRIRGWWIRAVAAIVALLVTAFAVAVVVMAGAAAATQPTYRRMTFGRATITSARFRPGTAEVVYDASINGQPRELFVTVPGTSEARSLAIRGAELLAVSPSGDIALSLNRRLVRGYVGSGTLAVVTEGRGPREVLDNVHWADWAGDGTSLAIVREVRGRTRLEFPINTILFETAGWISDVRFSPDGTRIAFVEHPVNNDDGGRVMLKEGDDEPRPLTGGWVSILGLAWSASRAEVWFTAEDSNGVRALRAVDLRGGARVVAHAPGRLRLFDISGDGRVLLSRDDLRLEAHGIGAGDTTERNLSWLDWSLARDISSDGTRLLITEYGEAAAGMPGIYLRPTDGSPAAWLGSGSGMALSPDGQRVLSISNGRLSLLPVGAGEVTILPHHGLSYHPSAGFFPDGRRIVFTGSEPGRATRVYVQDIPDGRPVPITPEGFVLTTSAAVSPAGDMVIAVGGNDELFLCSTFGRPPRRLPGASPGELVAGWVRGGRAVYVFQPSQIPARVFRLDLNGRRELVKTLAPDDLGGAIAIHRLVLTPAADAYAYTLERQLSDLYVAVGFRDPTLGAQLPLLRSILRRAIDSASPMGERGTSAP
jgi:eukaryotic-like serine/threonine-protein kinase